MRDDRNRDADPFDGARDAPDDRPNLAAEPLEDELQALLGEEMPAEQDAVVDADEIESVRQPTLSEQEWGVPIDPSLRSGETDDPLVAIEEGQTYVPPSDPPFVPSDDRQGIDSPGGPEIDAESDMNARVRDELRADAATSALADQLEIAVVGTTAVIRGHVEGVEDADAILEVVGRVPGISDVRDETDAPGI